MEDLNLIRKEAEFAFSDVFRKIWIQRSKNRMLITIFPKNGNYYILPVVNIKDNLTTDYVIQYIMDNTK